MSTSDGFEDAEDLITDARTKFAELYAENVNAGLYAEVDLERVRNDDAVVLQYVKHQKNDLVKTAGMMDSSLRFRQEMKINDLTESSFPRDLHEMGAVFFHGEDKKGQPVLYFPVKKCRKDPEKFTIMKQFVAWWIDKHWLKTPDKKVAVLFDMTDAGFSNVDIELLKFQISCFTTYYPALLDFMLIYEMPWVLNAIWKVIKTLLTPDQQKRVLFVKKNQIAEYIDQENLMVHMGGEDTYDYTYIPSEDSGFESIAGSEPCTPTEENGDDLHSICESSTSLVDPPTSAASPITPNKKRSYNPLSFFKR